MQSFAGSPPHHVPSSYPDANAQMTEEALKMQLIEGMFGNMTVK
jgi:hypothetical protein